MNLRTYILALFLGTFSLQALAQQDTSQFNSDELFKVGRELCFNKKRERGRYWLDKALEISPTYHDIRIFKARTLAWDDKYDEASGQLWIVLDDEPRNLDAIMALVDVYNWSDQTDSLLFITNYGLKRYPTNQDLLLAMAKALIEKEKRRDAVVILQQLLNINPANESAQELLKDLKKDFMFNGIAIDNSFDNYRESYGYQAFQNITYKRITKYGSINVRLNTAQRFGTSGSQIEFDAYPSLYKSAYAYVSYGYSGTDLYPDHRIGFELFQNLPFATEASLGFRHLDFIGSTVTIYTGTIGWYVGNMWLSARTYITPDEEAGAVSRSLTLRGRYYFGNSLNFAGFTAGLGYSPEAQLQPGSDIYFFRSRKISLEYQKTFGTRWIVWAIVGWSDLEPPFDRNSFIPAYSGSLQVEFRF